MKTSVRPTPDTCSQAGSSWPSTRYWDPTCDQWWTLIPGPASLQTSLSDYLLHVLKPRTLTRQTVSGIFKDNLCNEVPPFL